MSPESAPIPSSGGAGPGRAPAARFPRAFGGKYVLLKELGAGGMGRVYLATSGSEGMRRVCAIKTLSLPEGEPDIDELAGRFTDEARLVTQLAGDHLSYVFDAGLVGRDRYLAMEYIAGKSLTQVWNRCAERSVMFPLGVSMHVMTELTAALAYVHGFRSLGLAHRDVSPSNVMLSYSGAVKLIDFGIAKWVDGPNRTRAGVHWGKQGYKAPEQRAGKEYDRRADLYAAGVIFWELLAGRQLFAPGELPALRAEVPPPSAHNSVVPPELDQIALRATAHDPDERYQTAEQFGAAIARFMAPGNSKAWLAEFLAPLFEREIAEETEEQDRLVVAAASVSVDGDAAPERARDPILGTVLGGRYEVLRLIGRGAMGAVYEGYHTQIRKRVAIKIANPLEEDPILAKRLVVEAAAAGQIDHPNIAAVNDSGTTPGGAPFFVMEYLDGVDLEQVLWREGPLEPARAVRIGTQICKAAAAAHAAGVVHRDLKPANVMLIGGADGEERVKVMDFGLAKFTRPQAYAGLAGGDALTRPEAALGTPEYMAPEQLTAGADVDARADVYALGVIAYEMLAGKPPFDGDDPEALAMRKLREAPAPLEERRAGLPPELSRAVMRALAQDPAERPQSAGELAAALARAAPGAAGVQPRAASTTDLLPARPERRARAPFVGAGLVALLVAVVAVTFWSRRPPSVPAQQPPVAAPFAAPVAPPPPPPAAEALTSEASPPARPPAAEPVGSVPGARRPTAAPTAEPKPPAKTPKHLVEAGWDALEDSDTERAIALGRAALKAGGGGPAHFLLGKALLAAGLRREALPQLQKAAAANPRDKEAASMAENVRRLLEENP